jgi:glutamate dehydrogenase
MAKTLTLNTADLMGSTLKFPEYFEPFEFDTESNIMPNFDELPVNKAVDRLTKSPGRQPSPQPTHFSAPYKNGNGNGHRVLRSATVGYIAPEFKGKKEQMVQGM